MKYSIKYAKYMTNILIWVICIAFLIIFTKYLLPVCVPLILGWIIASLANPLVKFLGNKLAIKRKFASVTIIIAVLGLIFGGIYYALARVFTEIMLFAEYLPSAIDSLSSYFNNAEEVLSAFVEKIPIQYKTAIMDSVHNISGEFAGFVQNMTKNVVGRISNIASFFPIALITIVMTVVCSYFLLVDGKNIKEYIWVRTPENIRSFVKKYSPAFNGILSGYFYAQFKIMVIIALIVFIGLMILRVKFALPLSLLIAFLDFFPLLGTGFVIWPWMIMELISGNYYMVLGLLIIYAVTQIFRRVAEPKILGDSIGIRPIFAILLMFIGYKISSVFGLIFAVPAGMLIINLNKAGLFDDLKFIVKDVYNDIMAFADIDKYKKEDINIH